MDTSNPLPIDPEPAAGIWDGYDPEQVRAAIQRSAGLGSRATSTEALDLLIANIRAQRGDMHDDAPSGDVNIEPSER